MRTGDTDLCLAIGVHAQKAKIVGQSQRTAGEFSKHFAIIKIVIKLFRRAVELYTGKAFHEVVDHVVPPQFAVGDDVDSGHFLVFNGCLHCCVVNLVEVLPADAPRMVFGLQALQPPRHGITADDRCWKNR